ncbi:helix-turn-helix domain-containing protein [Micromonospora parva]|uniref:winged helix-turn-helix transcriptional regulator n=1 Tax=Micromonospora parva TaxID=1464048 RepID=UPI00340791D6
MNQLPEGTPPEATAAECRQVQSVLDTVGRRWSGAIMVAASRGARRFTDFRRAIPGISDRMLSQRLKELENLGLLSRTVVPTTPVQILYEPTARGSELLDFLQPLFRWGEKHLPALPPVGH